MYALNSVTVGTRIIIIIIIIISQGNKRGTKGFSSERQGKRYAAEKTGAVPKRTK
jgi:hypothetical protein